MRSRSRRQPGPSKTRLPVPSVIENLADLSIDEVIEQFDVTHEQVMAVVPSRV